MTHILPLKVYYEDTDMAGVVYYANYLRFIERARSEIVEEMGIDQRALRDAGIVFAVTRVEADYRGSARFGDHINVVTTHQPSGAVRWVFDQSVELNGKVIFQAKVTVACMTVEGKPTRLPAEIRASIAS